MRNFIWVFALLTIFQRAVYPQDAIWEIYTINNQPYVNVSLDHVNNEVLYLKAFGNTYQVKIDSIKIIKKVHTGSGHALAGFLIGTVAGGVAGNMISSSSKSEGLFIEFGQSSKTFFGTSFGILLGGLFGTVAGPGLDADKYYNFKTRNHAEKVALLNKLIQKEQQ